VQRRVVALHEAFRRQAGVEKSFVLVGDGLHVCRSPTHSRIPTQTPLVSWLRAQVARRMHSCSPATPAASSRGRISNSSCCTACIRKRLLRICM
jgi:hypothetical protein